MEKSSIPSCSNQSISSYTTTLIANVTALALKLQLHMWFNVYSDLNVFIAPISFENILLQLLNKVSNLSPILLNLLVLLIYSLPWTNNNNNQFVFEFF